MFPTGPNGQTSPNRTWPADMEQGKFDYWFMNNKDFSDRQGKAAEVSDAVSKLDLMAPGKARGEYNKGFDDLNRRNFSSAAAHLDKALAIYPKYVSAHNALGTALMNLGQNEKARAEFQTALSLDDHVPNTYSNLSRACLVIKDYPSAVQAMEKATALSPLNLQLRVMLAYAQLMNRDFAAVIATTDQVHKSKHDDAAVIHYFAAAAHQGAHNLDGMQTELQQFLLEDPKSPNADQARAFLARIEAARNSPSVPATTISYSVDSSQPVPAAAGLPTAARQAMSRFKLQRQVEAAECEDCKTNSDAADSGTAAESTDESSIAESRVAGSAMPAASHTPASSPYLLRSAVDEVGVFFAVTDGGRAVSDLRLDDIKLLDDRKAPAAVLGFRSEASLPLRLGFVVDTSASVTERFGFEQDAASEFLQQVLTGKKDLAFVLGVANNVLMVQDFTNSKDDLSAGIHKLAPSGGTALWDAVAFAAEKLGRPETAPVARILVVVSDGKDNSSSVTLEHAIETAQRNQVVIYTVSSKDEDSGDTLGDRALKVLAKQTGGASIPGSLDHIRHSLNDLQQVIRSRYLISYKPAQFVSDGRYRSIEIAAQKSGRKLRVYARKGYYAGPSAAPNSAN
jgi:VWFA-related protein